MKQTILVDDCNLARTVLVISRARVPLLQPIGLAESRQLRYYFGSLFKPGTTIRINMNSFRITEQGGTLRLAIVIGRSLIRTNCLTYIFRDTFDQAHLTLECNHAVIMSISSSFSQLLETFLNWTLPRDISISSPLLHSEGHAGNCSQLVLRLLLPGDQPNI